MEMYFKSIAKFSLPDNRRPNIDDNAWRRMGPLSVWNDTLPAQVINRRKELRRKPLDRFGCEQQPDLLAVCSVHDLKTGESLAVEDTIAVRDFGREKHHSLHRALLLSLVCTIVAWLRVSSQRSALTKSGKVASPSIDGGNA